MAGLPEPITSLISVLTTLPGIGPRSAERLALFLVQAPPDVSESLSKVILDSRNHIQLCSNCGGLTEKNPCGLCSDSNRDATIVCLVERPLDIFSIEKSGTFKGRYHVLGGKISPLNGIGPEDLRIQELESRIAREQVREVILALSTDVEGDATSYYLARKFAGQAFKVTRIAHGLPAGSGLDFADEITLTHALQGRREIQ
jgi:recombination protein RecR